MSFMFGSFLSGFLVGDNKFQLGKGYGVVLLIESAAIFGSFMFLKRELVIGEWCAAFACGLQNALATSYSGAAVRTTHMTGIITDIGNIIGQACRRDSHAEIWRLKVHVPLLFGFLVGGVLGQMAYIHFKENSLLVPCFFIGGMGALYLSLPFIRQAKVALEEAAHLVAGDGRPVVEIRYIGDPSKADMYAKTVNHDVEREIGDFIRTLGDVEGQGGSGGNGPRSTKSAHPKTPTGKKYEPLADVREDEHEVLYSSSPKDSPPGYEADPVKH
ncbi:uncharacterized protein BJ171DRAFT_500861 [Polychytrium aggregatum]|uniref:uncharacterized protein n=1 Tax=Polychytrium aggregatum TaxID=110093 RepID=UPI0022FF1ACB|nr:uncharacterized protein BJ171DRAFT_500861 [Polychytrium aggregatum]KAI9205590.1 hypothetical protein BJ171DRAFT_500861 [Polychytrium aggregatum]